MSAETGLSVEAVESARLAVEGADIVTVTAASNKPVLETAWIRPGALLTNIAGRALPQDIYACTRIVVPDLVGPVPRPSGWDPFPMTLNGGLDPSTIVATLVDLLHNPDLHARQQEDEIVLYEQLGTFAWDGAMNRWLYTWAVENQAGTLFHISSH
jgi:ornithine cyclodeaminase/alanine dehydrogenase-like protein (mu-crystallin family)